MSGHFLGGYRDEGTSNSLSLLEYGPSYFQNLGSQPFSFGYAVAGKLSQVGQFWQS
jgi:hypothetical protein